MHKGISFFSGAQGLDIGLEQAGIEIVLGQDIEQACVETIRKNGRNALSGDIRAIYPKDVLDMAGMRTGEAFLVCGGPPCQPFSTAGKRLGINDPRGSLFMDFLKMIQHIRPRFFVMENVRGLLSMYLKDADGHDTDTKVLDVILEQVQAIGYTSVYGVLNAVDYGVPQFRERFVLLASRDNERLFLPKPTHFMVHQDAGFWWQTLGDAILDLEDDSSECAAFSDNRLCYLRQVPQGGNWRDLPDSVRQQAMGGAYASGGGKSGFYRRLSYAEPCPTLTTSPVQKATMLCHPVKDRPLSVKEYARIQQFPDDHMFAGTMMEKYRQIGNAVPVGLARSIGQTLCAVADGRCGVSCRRVRGVCEK